MFGINIPPQQGESNWGQFIPGINDFRYNRKNFNEIRNFGFNAVRIPLNVTSAQDADTLQLIRAYVELMSGKAIICVWGHRNAHDSHGSGVIDDVDALTKAWIATSSIFENFPEVLFEIFNEPFGYKSEAEYQQAIEIVIQNANLERFKEQERIIVDARGYADRPFETAAWWKGLIGYHFYPTWQFEGAASPSSQSSYSNRLKHDLGELTDISKIVITEVGADLNASIDYDINYTHWNDSNWADVNCMRGFKDAIGELQAARSQKIAGIFWWHGTNNGDSYDVFAPGNANGRKQIERIMNTYFTPTRTAAAPFSLPPTSPKVVSGWPGSRVVNADNPACTQETVSQEISVKTCQETCLNMSQCIMGDVTQDDQCKLVLQVANQEEVMQCPAYLSDYGTIDGESTTFFIQNRGGLYPYASPHWPPLPGGVPPLPGGVPPLPGGVPPLPGGVPPLPGGVPPNPGGVPPNPGGSGSSVWPWEYKIAIALAILLATVLILFSMYHDGWKLYAA